MHRREMLRTTAMLALGAVSRTCKAAEPEGGPELKGHSFLKRRVCLFMDHLDEGGYSYDELARHLAQLGIAGADLTVRGGGVVAPQQAAEQLPRVAAAFADHGLSIPMLTTNLTSARDETAEPLLSTMSKLGIKYFKLGYYPYSEPAHWETQLAATRKELSGLVELARTHGLVAGLHNHAGPTVGGALWDGVELLQPLDATTVGYYFDPAHAMIEGGKIGWRLHLARIAPRLKMVALKDFLWEKVDGAWRTRWCPLGQGMVDWKAFFEQLAGIQFDGPLSLHIEYDPGGNSPRDRLEKALVAAQKDLTFLRQHWADRS